jgi:SOUL heme-binding protein
MPIIAGVQGLPTPSNSRVSRTEVPPRYTAVARFSGWPLEWEVRGAESALRRALARDGLMAAPGYTLARYNDPLAPPFLRRNEVIIDLPEFEWP